MDSLNPTPPAGADLEVLDVLQRTLPLVERPWAEAGRPHGWSEDQVLGALQRCRDAGWLSRVGPVFRPRKVGASTLAALSVPSPRLGDVAALVNSYDEVNHNYERAHPVWNLWFVVTAPDEARLRLVLNEISRRTGLDVLDLRLEEELRIDLAFPLTERAAPPAPAPPPPPGPVEVAPALLAAIQDGLPLEPRPFDAVAARAGCSVEGLLQELRRLVDAGAIKRFGAVANHRALGWAANAMCVWAVPPEHAAWAGARLAALPFVSLCYRRRPVPGRWPFNLYCMIHGRDPAVVQAHAAQAHAALGLPDTPHAVLFSTRCHKQRGARYAAARDAADLDPQDRTLVNHLQRGLLVEEHPFAAAARAAGLTEAQVVARLRALRERGVLSRFGPMFNVERFGGHFTLVAMRVPPHRFDEVAALVNAYPEVAHNYEREHALNMWFVLATATRARAQEVLDELRARTGLEPLDLPKEREFHLRLVLDA